MDERRDTILRFAVIFGLIALGFVSVIGQIIRIQTVERDRWLQVAEGQEPVYTPLRATRGNILDCNGSLLATSMPQYWVYMDAGVEALHEKGGRMFQWNIDTIASEFHRIIGDYTTDEYKQRITKAYRNNNHRLTLNKKTINYLQRRELDEIRFAYGIDKNGNLRTTTLGTISQYKSGIFYEPQHKRIKPFGGLASRTIGGIYGDGGYGNSGVEKAFDHELSGKDGIRAKQYIGGKRMYVTVEEAEDGMDVRTTIDANLQDIVEKALGARMSRIDAEWGCCILMETHSGEIKAIANLDRVDENKYRELQNHAVMRVEPGSTFKTIALMAALDDGKIDIDDTVRVSKNGWTYIQAKHTDAHPRDTVYTVRSALAVSSNIALAKIITHAYEGSAKKFVQRIGRMGLLDSVYCEIPGAQKVRIDVPRDTVTLSKMSYGYSVEMSPLQILMFYNAIANDGKMIRPLLVKSIEKDAEVVDEFETETVKGSICSSSTLRDIQGALHDVVWDNHLGTAAINPWGMPKAQDTLVHIAGKTGTAQLLVNGRYTGRRHRITFVGYFPEEDPQYTCICMMNDPKKTGMYDAGMDCGTVVKQIARKTMAYSGCYILDKEGKKKLVRATD